MSKNKLRSFPPVSQGDAQILVLGSMPGTASLKAQEYYAYSANAFWPIMGELFGFPPDTLYADRLQALTRHRIAVWDVLKFCERAGSLDSAIRKETEKPNDFSAFFAAHPEIRYVFFNGTKAEEAFRRRVLAGLEEKYGYLEYRRLPSTSPARTLSRAEKLKQWSVICDLS